MEARALVPPLGCSSSLVLTDGGHNETFNPYSWNMHANAVFLDQPINVGFSYSEDGSKINTSQFAGKDVYAFLELFLH